MKSNLNRKSWLQYIGIKHHEYWSWWLLVIPVWPFWILYAIRLRCATWFTVVNPGMEDSGFIGESKIKILDNIPTSFKPLTLFINNQTKFELVLEKMHNVGLQLPIICKPDIGGRGRKVELVYTHEQLRHYVEQVQEDFIIQHIIPYKLEFGVFYVRLPNEAYGKVTSLSSKQFLQVTGDGIHSILHLMKADYRASLQIERLSKSIDLSQIPPKDETILLEPIGNHCRGTAFISCQHLINDQLNQSIDHIAKQIPGFYYGRFDLKVRSLEDLYKGQYIQFMELNGLTADAAHIFDPQARLRDAFHTQIKQCYMAYQIAKHQLKQGAQPTPLFELIRKSWGYFKT